MNRVCIRSKIKFVSAVMFSISFFSAHAQDSLPSDTSQSSLKLEETNVPSGAEVDELISNKKMRAESGSKSKYSISLGAGYSGGSLETPFSEHRPNIAQGTGSSDVATLGGSASGKYAITSTHAILAGIGARWIAPLYGSDVPEDFRGNKVDVDNPYAVYQYIYRWLDIQSVVQGRLTYFTASNLVADGYVTTFGLSQNNAYLIPTTRFTVGVHAYVGVGYFDDNSPEAKTNQSDYSAGFSPFLEYQISDRWNLRTGSNLFIFQHLRSQNDPNTYRQQKITQNIGLGIAITRDIFISPGIDFILDDIRADRSTVSVGANVNIF